MSITGNQPKLRFRSEWLSEQEIPSPTALAIENRICAMYSKKMAEKKKRLQTYRACAETNAMQWWGKCDLTRHWDGFLGTFPLFDIQEALKGKSSWQIGRRKTT